MPGERRISWVAQAEPTAAGDPGAMLGQVHVLLLGRHRGARGAGAPVGPAQRPRPVTWSLRAARRVYQEGFQSIGVEVVGDTPAVGFYESLGFSREYVETRSVLDLSAVDWAELAEMAAGIGAGYRWSSTRAGRRTS